MIIIQKKRWKTSAFLVKKCYNHNYQSNKVCIDEGVLW